jgi:dTDP-4-dehydrorhamnose reductase
MLGCTLAATLADAVPVDRRRFEAGRDDIGRLLDETGCEWVVNAIGVLANAIDEDNPGSVANAMAVNRDFPRALAAAAGERGMRVIHATTDGVFSGRDGGYAEDARHDALDAYGRSKSGGEVSAPHVLNLRCSIVGPEPPPGRSLLAWLLSQPRDGHVSGFVNHRWNGVTTHQFACVCEAIVRECPALPRTLHLVPGDAVTKADLLGMLVVAFGREDLAIEPTEAPVAVDRSLSTLHPAENAQIWRAAGYSAPPKVAQMIQELASTPTYTCATSLSSSASGPT